MKTSYNVIGLISGGKDSIYNLMKCVEKGHRIICLANLYPPSEANSEEIDSYMYQTVGFPMIKVISECMEIPLFRRQISGNANNTNLKYEKTSGDETEDLYELLNSIIKLHPDANAVSVGAILSRYQVNRVENVDAILIKTACEGLLPREHLGKSLKEMYDYLIELGNKGICNPCGEGGEFETLVVNCPLYHRKIIITKIEYVGDIDNKYAPNGHIVIKEFHLKEK